MRDMPTLGHSKTPSWRGPVTILLVVGLCGAAGLAWLKLRREPPPPPPPPVAAAHEVSAPGPGLAAATPGAASATREQQPPAPVDDPVLRAGMHHVRAVVDGPLERAIVSQVGSAVGQALTQVITRELVWWVSVPGGLRRGDVVEALFQERAVGEPLLAALRFKSEKGNRTWRAYLHQPAGAPHPRYYDEKGDEIELRLKDSPLDEYDQITSLLSDGRGHAGVDFRVPLGTPVKSPFDAVVVRKNWRVGLNGNSLELRETGAGGRHAVFLHLQEVNAGLHDGEHVKRGEVVARSGNTGHSFAPHLHYQLMGPGDRVLDPFEVQSTYRRSLTTADRSTFVAEVTRLDGLLDEAAKLPTPHSDAVTAPATTPPTRHVSSHRRARRR